MSTKAIDDFLTKQIFIERNIVTYRLLSRQHAIHVNDAKNALATFYENARSRSEDGVVATYLLSGEVQPQPRDEDHDMDVDNEEDAEYNDGDEDVPEMRILLAGEKDLAEAKLQFQSIETIYLYSLSPSPIHDIDLLCGPMDLVRAKDAEGGTELAKTVGKIVTEGIKEVKNKGKGKMPPPLAPVAGPSKQKPAPEPAKNEKTTEVKKEAGTEKPKQTGKLDFSKAKTKAAKEKEAAEKKKTEEPKVKKEEKLKMYKSPLEKGKEKASETPQNLEIKKETSEEIVNKSSGRKKSAMLSDDSEDEAQKASAKQAPSNETKPAIRVKKGAILSDEEGEVVRKKPAKAKPKVVDSDEEDLRAMMDEDDDKVMRASRPQAAKQEETEDDEDADTVTQPPPDTDGDIDMADPDDIEPLPKRKRKPKKVWPVGRNGLKKKRVVKSKMTTDAKGYMVTEDYSSYESVDEEEEPEPPKKGKAKAASNKTATKKESVKEEPDSDTASTLKSKPIARLGSSSSSKAKAAGKGGQKGSITSFFGKPKK